MWMFFAWGLWVLAYGQFPVREGVVKGKDARIIGLGLILLAALNLLLPPEYDFAYLGFEVACLAVVYFKVKGEPPKDTGNKLT